jgi:hypothetical protein
MPVYVQLPNGQHIASTHTALLPLPMLPNLAQQGQIFPDLESNALLPFIIGYLL